MRRIDPLKDCASEVQTFGSRDFVHLAWSVAKQAKAFASPTPAESGHQASPGTARRSGSAILRARQGVVCESRQGRAGMYVFLAR